MIEPNELRLGNWVTILLADPQVVFDVLCDGVNTATHEAIPYDMVEPIELSEEILLKAGFEKQHFDVLEYMELPISNKEVDIYSGDKNGFLEVVIMIGEIEIARLRYLHTLQNWYNLLTGKELNIEL